MICLNISVKAASLIGSPFRKATVRAVLLSCPAVMMPFGIGNDAAVVQEHVDVILGCQKCADVAVQDEVRLARSLDALGDLRIGSVYQTPDMSADLLLPLRQSGDVGVNPWIGFVRHGTARPLVHGFEHEHRDLPLRPGLVLRVVGPRFDRALPPDGLLVAGDFARRVVKFGRAIL
jgi:hypothetical protein